LIGYISPSSVSDLTQKLLNMGCYEVSLGDTIGMGTPGSVGNMLSHLILEKDIPGSIK
jgi:hydroxymethylglutaryl-CoA lyase